MENLFDLKLHFLSSAPINLSGDLRNPHLAHRYPPPASVIEMNLSYPKRNLWHISIES